MSRRLTAAAAILLLIASAGCRAARTAAGASDDASVELAPEIARYAEAHRKSSALRASLPPMLGVARLGPPASEAAQAAWHGRLREIKREYFALRATLFELALLHASSIVDRREDQPLRTALERISLSALAGADLVRNFHEVAALLSEAPALRAVWDEPDPAHGIPGRSWDLALESYRDARYHDLFRQALERLTRHRSELERARARGEPAFVALYADGVEPALRDVQTSYTLLRARLAEEDLAQDEAKLRALVGRSKAARATWTSLSPTLRAAIARDRGLIRGDVHVRIQRVKIDYLELREDLYGLAFKHAPKLRTDDVPYPRDVRVKAVAISLLSAVTLYENAHVIESRLLAIPSVRMLLNQGDPALGIRRGFWDNAEREFLRFEYRALLEGGLRLVEEEEQAGAGPWGGEDPFLAYVSRELTPAATDALRDPVGRSVAWALRHYVRRLNLLDTLVLQGGKVQLSRLLGNVMGVFEFRKGKLFDQGDWVTFLRERVQPGDLLLERTPFRLTDRFIPGYFGHVAMYVGTVDDLRALGLVEHRWVAPHLGAVASGRTVVEALRQGTQIDTVEHFLNIDDLVIMRPKPGHIPERDRVQAIALAFTHIGKKYDFAFDNNTWDTIVCSELAFHSYVNVRWPFARVWSSYTIAPDDVAVMAGADPARPFELITFVQGGRVVHDRPGGVLNEAAYAAVLGRRYALAER